MDFQESSLCCGGVCLIVVVLTSLAFPGEKQVTRLAHIQAGQTEHSFQNEALRFYFRNVSDAPQHRLVRGTESKRRGRASKATFWSAHRESCFSVSYIRNTLAANQPFFNDEEEN